MSVIFKGHSDMVELVMDKNASFRDIYTSVKEKLAECESFFKNSKVKFSFSGKQLSDVELAVLKKLISGTLGDAVFDEGNDNLSQIQKLLEEEEEISKIHIGTLRSGSRISSRGSLVIVGDVNPGAEISARGNIIVLGRLWGVAHAGNDGNRNAFVFALDLQPAQIRIADVFTRSPDKQIIKNTVPEIASIRNGRIYVKNLQEI